MSDVIRPSEASHEFEYDTTPREAGGKTGCCICGKESRHPIHRTSNPKRYDWHTDGMWCIENGKWVSWADYERLQRHKAALLQLVREGLEIQSAATLVMWQKRLEFCLANEPPAHETFERRLAEACERLRRVAGLVAMGQPDQGMALAIDLHAKRLLGDVPEWSERETHKHTDECWEPDSGCDMGRNEAHAQKAFDVSERQQCIDQAAESERDQHGR